MIREMSDSPSRPNRIKGDRTSAVIGAAVLGLFFIIGVIAVIGSNVAPHPTPHAIATPEPTHSVRLYPVPSVAIGSTLQQVQAAYQAAGFVDRAHNGNGNGHGAYMNAQ